MKKKNTKFLIFPDLKPPSKASSDSILPVAQAKNFGAILASPIFSHSLSNPLEWYVSHKIYPDSERCSLPPLLTSTSAG